MQNHKQNDSFVYSYFYDLDSRQEDRSFRTEW
jgi:hypothetical protein